MKLKLSNLLAIIAVIFFLYYYFIQCPRLKANQQPPTEEQPAMAPMPIADTGVTPLLPPRNFQQENFSVTPIEAIVPENVSNVSFININNDDNGDGVEYTQYTAPNAYNSNEIYDMAGNVRPDNVMFAGNEPATSFGSF